MQALVRVCPTDEAYEELVVNKSKLLQSVPETHLMLVLQEILEEHRFFEPVFQGTGVWEYRSAEDSFVAMRVRPGWALIAQQRRNQVDTALQPKS